MKPIVVFGTGILAGCLISIGGFAIQRKVDPPRQNPTHFQVERVLQQAITDRIDENLSQALRLVKSDVRDQLPKQEVLKHLDFYMNGLKSQMPGELERKLRSIITIDDDKPPQN